MVIDKIDNAAIYYGLGERIAASLKYIKEADFISIGMGRHDIDSDNIFALVQEYTTKKTEQAEWETHRKYIDVQYVADGEEQIGYVSKDGLPVAVAYDEDDDCEYYTARGSFVHMKTGMFMILMPGDAHAPGVMIGEQKAVRKVVVKAKL